MIKEKLIPNLEKIIAYFYELKIAQSISIATASPSFETVTLHQGQTSLSPLVKTDEHTVYDLASLTKIMLTTLALADAISKGFLTYKKKPFSCWPQVSVKDLFGSSSRLKAHKHFYLCDEVKNAKSFHDKKLAILQNLWQEKPFLQKRVYTDLGFIALGHLLETIYQKPLYEIGYDVFLALGFSEALKYFPSTKSAQRINHLHVAPTGYCPIRKVFLRAQVNDLNCFFMGGIAGHAGLFSTINLVVQFGSFVLKAIKSPKIPIEHEIKFMAQNRLGFDFISLTGSTSTLSPCSVGHFGYTGTSLWIDPKANNEQGLVIALLTNRTLQGHFPEGIFSLRKKIHATVLRAFS